MTAADQLSTNTTGSSRYGWSPGKCCTIGMVPASIASHALGLGSWPPPCTHITNGYFCMRSKKAPGSMVPCTHKFFHTVWHSLVSLARSLN